ncbi:hypothetical protein CG716_05160 [Mycolicibacterium sphagni]|uniref:DUF6378 domain-containing protein n=1 Tax=Mycolicibacterium sphagni TaxID=1786 RepID=A0A255DR77_9MYCO|nr:DUF6378 domain-containing protein [Mycolicibacterium sphagni]OYN81744.1 hypothetical protein CG716_05160 [Mycolicibacterium sphagni]
MTKETVCQEAERIINGQRQQDYGDTAQNWNRIAELWSAYLGTKISALDAINLLLLMKVSRAKRGYHRDSYVDTAGYAGLAEKINSAEQPKAQAVLPSIHDTHVYTGPMGAGLVTDHMKAMAAGPKAFA